MKHRLFALSLFLILVAPGLMGFAPPRQGRPQLDLAISAGYGSKGYFRYGQLVPVRVVAENVGDPLDGEIRVRLGKLSGLADITYRASLYLATGDRKQLFLYVSLDIDTHNVQVEVLDHKQRLITSESVPVQAVGQGDILYAVVASTPHIDLGYIASGTNSAYQASWQIEDIPPRADALAGLDVLVFHDIDTSALEVDAIANWVLSGGHLIVAAGDSWSLTTAGLQSLLPVTLQGSHSVDTLAALADYVDAPVDELAGLSVTLARTVPNPGAQTLAMVDDIPLIVRGAYGAGIVDFLAVDPRPLESWTGKEQLWRTLVLTTGQRPSWLEGVNNWGAARQATRTTSSAALPTFFQLCGFLLLYIALVGPVNYLVLKRLNRRELAWFTIPVLTMMFSVLAYTVGFNLRGNVAIINRLTVVQVWPDSDQAQVTNLIGIQSPRRARYDITVERDYVLRALPDSGGGAEVPATITKGTQYVAESVPIDAGMVASFVATGYTTASHVEGTVTWHLSENQSPRVEGYVTNTTGMVLYDAVVLLKSDSYPLGTIAPGETKTFEMKLNIQEPGTVTLANPLHWRDSYNVKNWCFSYKGAPLTIPQIMFNAGFPCEAGNVSAHKQQIRQRYQLLASMIADAGPDGERDTRAYLFAWTDNVLVDVELVGQTQEEEDTTLYIFDLPVTVVADTPRIEIPPGLMTWLIVETSEPNVNLNNIPVGKATLQFMPFPALKLGTVEELDIRFDGRGEVQVALWNWDEQAWTVIVLPDNAIATTITDPDPFIGPENMVNVRVQPVGEITPFMRVKHLSIVYRGQLVENAGTEDS